LVVVFGHIIIMVVMRRSGFVALRQKAAPDSLAALLLLVSDRAAASSSQYESITVFENRLDVISYSMDDSYATLVQYMREFSILLHMLQTRWLHVHLLPLVDVFLKARIAMLW
jgi:hypothetical protein